MNILLNRSVNIVLAISFVVAQTGLIHAKKARQKRDSHMKAFDIPYTNWNTDAQNELAAILNRKDNTNVAKNVIIVIGDGMGVSTVTASRMLKIQEDRTTPDKTRLSFEKFHHTGVGITWCADVYAPDSACTATSILGGYNGQYGTVGVTDRVLDKNCSTYTEEENVKSILAHAIDAGKWTGIVTNTRLTHATPAPAFASSPSRNWEAGVPDDCKDKLQDISTQLVKGKYGKDIRVLLGGGRLPFLPENVADLEHPNAYGWRKDNISLIDEWLAIKKQKGLEESKYKYVSRQSEFDAVDIEETEYLLGMFETSYMQFEHERENDVWGEPSLTEMAEKAVKILDKSSEGYFLLVESGRIDHGHHGNALRAAQQETLELDRLVERLVEMTDEKETLLIVTADHGHVMTISWGPKIGENIYGAGRAPSDGKPALLFNYADGPGWATHRSLTNNLGNETFRKDITDDIESGATQSVDYILDAGIPYPYESHSGEEVVIYAQGPMSHLFAGTHYLNYVAHAAMYAACLGSNKAHCDKDNNPTPEPCPTSQGNPIESSLVLSFAVIVAVKVTY